jgi:hypothetical protein
VPAPELEEAQAAGHDSTVPAAGIWLRSPRFDWTLQVGALAGIAPPLLIYAAADPGRAESLLPLASLIAIPFLHVFGSFFFAFSAERNRSPSPPLRLALVFAAWLPLSLVLAAVAPRGLATFALVYGGWHILRQNFGFLRELAGRAGVGGDRALRRLDLAASAAPALALWLFISARGPWRFMGAEVHHLPAPAWLVALAFVAVLATALARRRRAAGRAATLLLAGNAFALLGPALALDDLTLIYTLSASYHGIQYLAYLAERERERLPDADATRVLLPLASAILLSTLVWLGGLTLLASAASALADRTLLAAWYAIVPFHYFVDGKIWRR